MKRKILIALGVLIFIIAALAIFIKIKSEPKPVLMAGDGNQMATEMMTALDVEAYEAIDFLHWNFRNKNTYVWDKKQNLAVIKWGDKQVNLNLDKLEGNAFVDGKKVGNLRNKWMVRKAWKFWCNDSYWLLAPFKVFDPGTTRAVAQLPDGTKGLWVEYASGGVTPGDGYFWKIGADGKPTAFKLWVSIIPVKGVEATWERWEKTESGALFSTAHNLPFFLSEIKELKEGHSWTDFGFDKPPVFP